MLQIVKNLMNRKTKINILYKIKKLDKNFRKIFKNFEKFIVKFWAKLKTIKLTYKKILVQQINFIKLLHTFSNYLEKLLKYWQNF